MTHMKQDMLSNQQLHWEISFAEDTDMFGGEPSESALFAAEFFMREGKRNILELGAGQGRDTFFFAQQGFKVWALEYTETGVKAIHEKSQTLGLSESITVIRHNASKPFPFRNEAFDACYSHMLYCMAFTGEELKALSSEIRRMLKPDGINIYTVRTTDDKHFGLGIHRGENMYEFGGFVVRFFSEEKVRQLAEGYEIVDVAPFEEGDLPRSLIRVTLRKSAGV